MKNKSEKKLKSNGNAAEASAAGLSKTGILAEAIGGISDEFVKAAEDHGALKGQMSCFHFIALSICFCTSHEAPAPPFCRIS